MSAGAHMLACGPETLKMDVKVFLQAQDWLLPDSNCRHHEPPVEADASSKKPKLSALKCKARFHICLDEQQTAESSTPPSSTWCGLLASGAVNIRLRVPDGISKATLDATINIPQQQHDSQQAGGPHHQPPALHISWYGQQFAVCAQHITKVRHGLHPFTRVPNSHDCSRYTRHQSSQG